MANERLSFDITASDHASRAFKSVGDEALKASGKMDIAAASAKLWDQTVQKQGKAAATSEAAMKSHAKAAGLLADAENVLAGRATKTTKLMADQGRELGNAAKSAETAAGGLSTLAGTGGIPGGGMGAAVAAGVALSPVIATLGVGLAGFGAAAIGVVKPIEDAASKTGGLQKNMHLLNPEQQAVARGLLGLGKQYQQFQNALQPEVLSAFGTGLHLVSGLMRDVQPVAKATGLAVDSLLTRVDTEFRSQTWQSFFGFMARTAAPDMKLLGDTLINLTDTLPPLLKDLQPVATTLLELTAVTTKGIDITARLSQGIGTVGGAAKSTNPWLHALGVGLKYNTEVMFPFIAGTTAAKRELDFVSGASDKSKQALAGWSKTGLAGAIAAHGITTALNGMNAAVTTSIAKILTLEGDEVSWKQAQQAATTAINANHKALDGNSASALAARAAIIAATTQVIKFADDSNTSTGALRRGSDALQNQIGWLEKHAGKSKIAAQEIQALRDEEAKIQREIDQRIKVTGSGRFSVAGSGLPGGIGHRTGAAGGRVPGFGGGDVHPYLLEGGESIVPKHLTPAVAPFLKAQGVPGFASGGLVPSYSGGVPGLGPWALGNTRAVLASLDKAVASAAAAALSSFGAVGGLGRAGLRQIENWWIGAGGPGGGTAHVAAAITGAESGFNPRAVQQGQPYATTGWGLWQITPGNSEPQAGINGQLLNGPANARAAVAKFNQAGGSFSPWTTFESGAYRAFMDNGGWLQPGKTLVTNNTGRPERVLPPGHSASGPIRIELVVRTAAGAVVEVVQHHVSVNGGNVQVALGEK